MRSAVTVCLVPQARGGPFIFWDGLESACRQAASLGFAGIEVFPTSAEAVKADDLRRLLDQTGLELAAVGTGAGWLLQQLSLTDADVGRRRQAIDFVKRTIDLAGSLGASAIVGSMQGRVAEPSQRAAACRRLWESLDELARHARQYQVPLLYEPLNRYETNLCNTLAEASRWIDDLAVGNVLLLADLFHMNIEETNIAQGLRQEGDRIGHVHFVDSNRRPAGQGHLDYAPIVAALREIGYAGFLSAEALPHPDSQQAARLAITAFNQWFR